MRKLSTLARVIQANPWDKATKRELMLRLRELGFDEPRSAVIVASLARQSYIRLFRRFVKSKRPLAVVINRPWESIPLSVLSGPILNPDPENNRDAR